MEWQNDGYSSLSERRWKKFKHSPIQFYFTCGGSGIQTLILDRLSGLLMVRVSCWVLTHMPILHAWHNACNRDCSLPLVTTTVASQHPLCCRLHKQRLGKPTYVSISPHAAHSLFLINEIDGFLWSIIWSMGPLTCGSQAEQWMPPIVPLCLQLNFFISQFIKNANGCYAATQVHNCIWEKQPN